MCGLDHTLTSQSTGHLQKLRLAPPDMGRQPRPSERSGTTLPRARRLGSHCLGPFLVTKEATKPLFYPFALQDIRQGKGCHREQAHCSPVPDCKPLEHSNMKSLFTGRRAQGSNQNKPSRVLSVNHQSYTHRPSNY